jgi:hypothetical protein
LWELLGRLVLWGHKVLQDRRATRESAVSLDQQARPDLQVLVVRLV